MYDKSHNMTVGEIAGKSYPKKKKSSHKKVAGIRRPFKNETKKPKKKDGY